MIETLRSSRRVWNRLTIDIRSEASTIDTGSSATISFGVGDQGARHRDALQLPARQLVREAAADFGERQADALRALRPRSLASRRSSRRAAEAARGANRYSSILVSGLKASNGFWKTG